MEKTRILPSRSVKELLSARRGLIDGPSSLVLRRAFFWGTSNRRGPLARGLTGHEVEDVIFPHRAPRKAHLHSWSSLVFGNLAVIEVGSEQLNQLCKDTGVVGVLAVVALDASGRRRIPLRPRPWCPGP